MAVTVYEMVKAGSNVTKALESSNQGTRFPKRLPLYFLLAIAVLLVYGRVWRFDFVNYDDPVYVTENLHIRTGLSVQNIGWAFTRDMPPIGFL